uniref:Uncharacterized protein n=1 Tax=Panagrolaimus davidi TaxID=227884 RepID=A0A914PEH1_9BILA
MFAFSRSFAVITFIISSDDAASTGSTNLPNEFARANGKDEFGAKRQALATLSHLGSELSDSVVYKKEHVVRGTVQNGNTQVNPP